MKFDKTIFIGLIISFIEMFLFLEEEYFFHENLDKKIFNKIL